MSGFAHLPLLIAHEAINVFFLQYMKDDLTPWHYGKKYNSCQKFSNSHHKEVFLEGRLNTVNYGAGRRLVLLRAANVMMANQDGSQDKIYTISTCVTSKVGEVPPFV